MPTVTRVRARFGWFAVGHFTISAVGVLCFILLVWTDALWVEYEELVAWVLCVFLMLLYSLAGYLCSRNRKWSWPDHRHGLLAVLLPALVAWGVAAFGLTTIEGVGAVFLLSTGFWASPSFLLMLISLTIVGVDFNGLFLFFAFLAGFLPPLLFYWGSLLGVKPVDGGGNDAVIPQGTTDPRP